MKIEKNKIVFAAIILCVVLFIGSYTIIMLNDEDDTIIESNQISIPELKKEQKEYDSKLEALKDLKEEQEITAPSIYPDHMIDEKGYFNPDYMEHEKNRIIDSIYYQGRISYSDRNYRKPKVKIPIKLTQNDSLSENDKSKNIIVSKELDLEHQLFFASNPFKNENLIHNTDSLIYVRIDGTQIVRNNYRLNMRLINESTINNILIPKNTTIYGFVSFKPNRTIIEINNINNTPVKLKAYDLQDGAEGIYIKNSFRAEARQEVVGDIVDDINIAGVPQISGIKKIFQHNNQSVKVTVTDNYQLILKPTL